MEGMIGGSRMPSSPPQHKQPKLTPAQRVEIVERRDAGERVKDLAVEFRVSASLIRSL